VSRHRPFLLGTSLERTVIPTTQASRFRLQYFPLLCVMLLALPSFAVNLFSRYGAHNVP
jgi:hypothetical protein